MDRTVLPANTIVPASTRKRSPDGTTTNCAHSLTDMHCSLLLIY